MERKHAFRPHKIDITNEIVVIGVIRKRKYGVNLIAIDRIRVDPPATNHGDTFARDLLQHA